MAAVAMVTSKLFKNASEERSLTTLPKLPLQLKKDVAVLAQTALNPAFHMAPVAPVNAAVVAVVVATVAPADAATVAPAVAPAVAAPAVAPAVAAPAPVIAAPPCAP